MSDLQDRAKQLEADVVAETERLYADPHALADYAWNYGPLERGPMIPGVGGLRISDIKADIMRMVARNVVGDEWEYSVSEIVGGGVVFHIGRYVGRREPEPAWINSWGGLRGKRNA